MRALASLILVLAPLAGCCGTCDDGTVEHEVNGVTVSSTYSACDRRCAKETPRTECACSRKCPCWEFHPR